MTDRGTDAAELVRTSPERRAAALARYGILDTEAESDFDDLIRLASVVCGAPMAALSFLDGQRQWFKARLGLTVSETEIEASFCSQAVAAGPDVFVVTDAETDPAFASNRLVTGDPHVRFYAGAPLITPEGVGLGALCVLDEKQRSLTEVQTMALELLSRQAVALLEARRLTGQLAVAASDREDALVQAAESAQRTEAVFAGVSTGLMVLGTDGELQEVNAAFAAMLGYARTELDGRHVDTITVEAELRDERAHLDALLTGAETSVVRTRHYPCRDGSLLAALTTTSVIRDDLGHLSAVLFYVQPLDEQHRAEEALMETQSALDAIVSIDSAGRVTAWNDGAQRLFGWSRMDMLGCPISVIVPAAFRAAHNEGVARLAAGGEPHLVGSTIEVDAERRDGTTFPVELSLSAWTRGDARRYTAIVRGISERRRLQTEMLERAQTDPITGAGTRGWFVEQLAGMLVDPSNVPVSVIAVDIDGFSELNDSLGPDVCDRLLIRAAHTLQHASGGNDILARIGSDSFAVATPRTSTARAARVTDQLQQAIRAMASEMQTHDRLQISAGAATRRQVVSAEQARDMAATLLRNANLALATAQHMGPGSVVAYKASMHHAARRRQRLHTRLRAALEADKLRLAYQPQLDLLTGRVVGVEALARWSDPHFGPVSPAEFIPIAEASGLAPQLGTWALRTACQQAAAWARERPHPLRVSVNVSGTQLGDDSLYDVVDRSLDAAGLAPDLLTLEITESVLLTDPTGVAKTLAAIRGLGCRIALDDFGTGYSSLSALLHLPVDEIKIDRSFVAPLPNDERASRLVATVVSVGRGLGAEIVAEGVETIAQDDRLRSLGVELGQGYLYGRPAPAGQLALIPRARRDVPPAAGAARPQANVR